MNKKNKADYTNNYLAKKIEEALAQPPPLSKQETQLILPIDVIVTECGIKPAAIIQYLVGRIMGHTRNNAPRPP